jgi:hypothetical protein
MNKPAWDSWIQKHTSKYGHSFIPDPEDAAKREMSMEISRGRISPQTAADEWNKYQRNKRKSYRI